ncbi:peptidoglycan DD-metalloendopeptidase family protein [Aestuariibacter halophilus]|uniref:Peptidoglycan DD-metalloendopeptidase family protein n=1 Tax=Fluctibacter halophilus TaxID=226011 RepID=A0ABS8G9Y7_9ALTE|nr:peptidoglycan DD-metalloendopeptidase family protein [Aestuariibacter halophilus]MCC2617345.1 peptidoglycan DD-metalloendopeptidase family protein [Aestuariibacter halophilus]
MRRYHQPSLSLARALCGLCLCWWVGIAPALAQQSDELEALQDQIKARQAALDTRLKEAKALQDTLKAEELRIAETARALNQTQISLENNRHEQQALNKRKTELLTQLDEHQSLLAKQLRSAYMTGNHDYAKMLLNQQNAGKLERMLTYYNYLNTARQEQIETFRTLVAELRDVEASLQTRQAELAALQQEQKAQRQTLAARQATRQQTLDKLERAIDDEAARIEQLQINEQALLKAIAEAERASRQRPTTLSGLAKLKGKLQRPAEGRMRNLFGTRRQGQVRWKGALFEGSGGAPVRAIHDGKVLFSDWLRGFGLVTVIDHGDGYMSLYGHNQALLKQAGDGVSAGETIALVGQSGGQTAPNLYFEIRHKGTAVNPGQWLRKR